MARDPYRYFRVEARDLTDQLGRTVLELERTGAGSEVVGRLLRLAHTLKGAARVVRLPTIAEHAHSIEDVLSPLRESPGSVPHKAVDALLGLVDRIAGGIDGLAPPEPPQPAAGAAPVQVDAIAPFHADPGELDGLIRNAAVASAELSGLARVTESAAAIRKLTVQITDQLGHASPTIAASTDQLRTLSAQIERASAVTRERVDRELSQLRETAEQLRLVPAGMMFATLERAARDTAQLLGKQVSFDARGSDVRLDGRSLKAVQDAVVQLVRNAVAHGVEVARDRIASSKPPLGRVSISVTRRSRRIVFRCEDDGRGIDIVALTDAVARTGRAIASTGDGQLATLLLQGGVSTSPFVSEAAGRGIGMDIVREVVGRIGADFDVGTEAGRGTWFELAIPLSLSSIDCLLLEGQAVGASIGLASVRRTRWIGPGDIHRTVESEAIIEDGRAVPLIALSHLLGGSAATDSHGHTAIIVQSPSGAAALSVTRIIGTANVVFRPLPVLAPSNSAIEGASFDADGNPLLMLNADGIIAAALSQCHTAATASRKKPPLLIVDDSLTTRMLEQSILESAGFEVDMAVSAEEGLERVRARDYGLILVDVEMPGMDGFGFVTELRRNAKTRDVPAILVTSRNSADDRRRGSEAGAQGYVVKSEFDQATLLGRIHQLVS